MRSGRSTEDYPRPAFGLRPWFALLRRARSLRRFAFAMTPGSVAGATGYPVLIARSPLQRLLGVHGVPVGCGVLMRGRSVHGRWLSAPIAVVWLDRSGRVLDTGVLRPRATLRMPGAAFALELPDCPGLPRRGDCVRLVQSSNPCREP